MGRRPIGGIFSVGVEEPYRWKDSVQSEPEIRQWVAEGTANGMRPWFTKFSGTLYDRRWLPVVERIYEWHATHERYLRNEWPLARVAMLYSDQTETFHAGAAQGDRAARSRDGHVSRARRSARAVRDGARGVPHARSARSLQAADPGGRGRAVRRAVRGDPRVRRARRQPARDVRVLALRRGRPRRDNFGLADLFGVSFGGRIDGPMQNSYLSLDADPATGRRHPVLDGLDDTPRIINGVFRVHVTPTWPFPSPLTLIPSYPDLPMEDVYPRVPHTDTRELYLREIGAGRVAYVPWDIDRTFWEVMAPDHGRLLRNARLGHERAGAREVDRPRPHRRYRWRQRGVDDRASREPDQPDDDERPAARDDPDRSAHGSHSHAAGARPAKMQLLTAGATPRTTTAAAC